MLPRLFKSAKIKELILKTLRIFENMDFNDS